MTHLFLDNSFIKIKFMKSYRIVFANLIFGLAFFFCTNALAEQKHTKISSEEISDGREYSLLFSFSR